MGLDLYISLKNVKDVSKYTKFNDEDLTIQDDTVSLYYRLNWAGVSEEYHFLSTALNLEILSLKEKANRRVSKSNIKKNSVYVVEGETVNRYSGRHNYTKITKGKFIKKSNKNLIRIKHSFFNIKVYKYKFYELKQTDIEPISALNLICLGAWKGSNGESFSLKYKDNKLICDEINNFEDEEISKENIVLDSEQLDFYLSDLNKLDNKLELLLEKKPDHYIGSKSKILTAMLKDLTSNSDSILYSDFC